MAQMIKNPPANAGDADLILGQGRSPGEGNGNPLQYSCVENPEDRGAWWAAVDRVTQSLSRLKRLGGGNAGDPGLISGQGRSPGEGNGNRLQYSCLQNSMGRGAWWAIVHGVTKSWT